MKIAYCMPVWNEQNNIAQSVNSILNQNDKGVLYIAFDASTDNTKEIFYKSFDKEIRNGDIVVVADYNERIGHAKLRNITARATTEDIIAICDADIYYKNRGTAIMEFFMIHEDKHVFSSALTCRSSENPNEIWIQGAYEWDFNSKCPISFPTVAFRREVWEKQGFFEVSMDTCMYEFFLLEAHKNGFQFGGCQDPLMLKIEGNTNRKLPRAWDIKREWYKKYGIEI